MAELNLNVGEAILKRLDFINEKYAVGSRAKTVRLALVELDKQWSQNELAWPPEYLTAVEKAKRIITQKHPQRRGKKKR
jgi:hypothetical protein